MNKTTNKYTPEVRERAVRMVLNGEGQHESRWSAILSISSKIGCTPQTLNEWVKKGEVDTGQSGGITTEMAEKMKALERENRELKQGAAPRVRHGLRRDDGIRVHQLPAYSLPQHGGSQHGRGDPLSVHELAPHDRNASGRAGRLLGAEEPDRLGQRQWWHGHVLPLPRRADLCLQGRHRAPCVQLRAGSAWALCPAIALADGGQQADGTHRPLHVGTGAHAGGAHTDSRCGCHQGGCTDYDHAHCD